MLLVGVWGCGRRDVAPDRQLTVFAAGWLADAFRRTKWVERALNWGFAGIFTAFAVTILAAQAKH